MTHKFEFNILLKNFPPPTNQDGTSIYTTITTFTIQHSLTTTSFDIQ